MTRCLETIGLSDQDRSELAMEFFGMEKVDRNPMLFKDLMLRGRVIMSLFDQNDGCFLEFFSAP